MNSERDLRRYAARRASLSVALREGHVGAAARAASRLRVDGFRIPREEFARARAVRRTLGLALVNARIARPAAVASRATPIVARGRPWRALVAVLAAAAALLLVLLFAPNDQARGGGSAPPALPAETQRAPQVDKGLHTQAQRFYAIRVAKIWLQAEQIGQQCDSVPLDPPDRPR